MNENAFYLKKLHNHRARMIDDTPMRELRNILGEQCVAHSPTPFSQSTIHASHQKVMFNTIIILISFDSNYYLL